MHKGVGELLREFLCNISRIAHSEMSSAHVNVAFSTAMLYPRFLEDQRPQRARK
jgi:hypothetical protein